MKHVQRNQIRRRQTDHGTTYVMGEQVRSEMIALTAQLKELVQTNQLPTKWNKNDKDALETMDHWLADDRDFSDKQMVKFFRMLHKFGLPDNFNGLAKQLDWEIGRNINRSEMYNIMQERRDNDRLAKVEGDRNLEVRSLATSTYNSLFE